MLVIPLIMLMFGGSVLINYSAGTWSPHSEAEPMTTPITEMSAMTNNMPPVPIETKNATSFLQWTMNTYGKGASYFALLMGIKYTYWTLWLGGLAVQVLVIIAAIVGMMLTFGQKHPKTALQASLVIGGLAMFLMMAYQLIIFGWLYLPLEIFQLAIILAIVWIIRGGHLKTTQPLWETGWEVGEDGRTINHHQKHVGVGVDAQFGK